MFDLGGGVFHLDVWKGVGAALVADEHGVALGVVAGAGRTLVDAHLAAIGVLAALGRDSLGDDGAAGVLAQVDHLGAGVGLLALGGEGHGVEFADGIVALQDAAGVLPGDGRAGFDLGPGDLGVDAPAGAALGDEVVDAAPSFVVARIPVLHGGVFDLGVVEGDQFDHGGVELVLVADGRGAAFQVGHVCPFFGDDQGALELSCVGRVDAEVGAQLHGTAHALGDVHEGAVAEDRGVEGGEEVVVVRDDRAQVFPDQIGVVMHGFGEGAEDDAQFGEFVLEGGGHGDRVEDRVNGHAGQQLLLGERDAEFLVGAQQFGVDLVQALRSFFLLGRRVVDDVLVVDVRVVNLRPALARLPSRWIVHLQPVPVGLQAPLEQPLRLVLLGGDESNDVLIQARGRRVLLDVGHEPVLVFPVRQLVELVGLRRHPSAPFATHPGKPIPRQQAIYRHTLLRQRPKHNQTVLKCQV